MGSEFVPSATEREGTVTESPSVGARTRRSLLTAGLAAAGAFVAQAIGRPADVAAAGVTLGAVNSATTATTIQNTASNAAAWGISGKTTYTGAASGSRGVIGTSMGTDGVGVAGQAHTGTGARGVLGISNTGTGVRGTGGPTGVMGTGNNYGVRGTSTSNYGVAGEAGYAGVLGTGGSYGVYGTGTSAGVVATTSAGYGVYSQGPIGVLGIGSGTGYGVWGYNSASGGYGVVGQGGYRGVYGSGGNAGVFGTSGYVGMWGEATTSSGLNFGVYAITNSTGGYAGVFSGAVQVTGFLSKLGGGFKIDHPLDPANKYLVHSFVESPEMLNVYSGTATLDAAGKVTVDLPSYFEAENRDVRYQLTAIGAAMPDLHVASGVKKNKFAIAGGSAGQKVSWQVSGVRQDAWANANPLEVEPAKAVADRGRYLQPKVHGKTDKQSIYPTSIEDLVARAPKGLAARPAEPTIPDLPS